METNRIKGLLLLASGAVLGFGLAIGTAVLAGLGAGGNRAGHSDRQLLGEVLDNISREYVEPVATPALVESAVRGMMTSLDAHSRFLDATEFAELRSSTAGHYTGVGLQVQATDDRVVVIAPIAGSAADRAGLRAGDELVSVDGVAVTPGRIGDVIARLRGKSGTPVLVMARRAATAEPIPFHLLRGPVTVHSVRAELLPDGIGYLRITQFSDRTAADVRGALERLRRPHGALTGLVLDLRDNPGGVLEAAVAVADAFLERGIIVTASGRTRSATFRHDAAAGDLLDGAPLAVLINGNSASAAEIVAGALRDHGRATLLGSRTFGKGSVQTVLPLSDGRALKLTTSRYFTPRGESIQERGIEPDVPLPTPAALGDAVATDPQVVAAIAALAPGRQARRDRLARVAERS